MLLFSESLQLFPCCLKMKLAWQLQLSEISRKSAISRRS